MLQYFIIFSLLLIPSNASYDYYTFSQQWPPTYCASIAHKYPCKAQSKTLHKFTIHGLWPSNYTGASKCVRPNSVPMVAEKGIPTTLKNALASNWPNLLRPSDYSFWTHEWDTHGKCSSFSNHPLAYFQHALKIQSKSRKTLEAILQAANIKINHAYTKDHFTMTIFNSINAYPELKCFKDNNDYHLQEIRLCLDYNGNVYKNCTVPSNTCGTYIKW